MRLRILWLLIIALVVFKCNYNPNTKPSEAPEVSSGDSSEAPDSSDSSETDDEKEEESGSEETVPEETLPEETEPFVYPEYALPVQEIFGSLSESDARLFYFYFYQLNDTEKMVYNSIAEGVYAMKSRINLAPYRINPTTLGKVVRAFVMDQPNLFYYAGNYSFLQDENRLVLTMTPSYLPFPDFSAAKTAFETSVSALMNETAGLNAIDAETYVLRWLCENTRYQKTDFSQSAYSALAEHLSVCAGYTRAFQLLMMKHGIPCYYCSGTLSYNSDTTVQHCWNVIKINDVFYNVDLVISDQDSRNYVDYRVFNVADGNLVPLHLRREMSLLLPACTSDFDFSSVFGVSRGVMSAMDCSGCNIIVHSYSGILDMVDAKITDAGGAAVQLSFIVESPAVFAELDAAVKSRELAATLHPTEFSDGVRLVELSCPAR